MMRLDEAQKLFFMRNKVNNVLISNQGDELGGLALTDAVSKRLSVLGDGAGWIWEQAGLHFPGARQVLDYWHGCQHVWDAAKAALRPR